MARNLMMTMMALALGLLMASPAAAQEGDGLAVPYDEVAPLTLERGGTAPARTQTPGASDVSPGVVTPGAQAADAVNPGAQSAAVTPASRGLALTGFDLNVGMALALVLLAGGVVALIVAARREHRALA